MHIRPFEEKDRSAVIRLWKETGLVVPHNDPDKDIDRKLEVNPELFLVGEAGGELVATVMGGYEGHRGWINYLAVKPGRQRSGHGRLMAEAVERLLAAKGCPKINLQIRATNTDVIEFYTALGYGNDNVVGLGKRLIQDQ
ncbi:MAG: GNAT family acetyltransferase [Natronospirillum sp.]|uniref:GNAT family acetyltransferase n=1 Tax=Natronospirillum sp. TaxID=2812955 RepID=UPI0025ED662B|nr:GNAT family acetyltransferase [Natronospirillum sp.]MCH8552118.1 GNAT family acetyltransferase [Natronospirillum sp.]